MNRPPLLLLDEPFDGLDLGGREDLIDALARLADEEPPVTTVVVTHHVEELAPSTTHALLLRAGRVVAAGAVAEVLTDGPVSACFDRPVAVRRESGRWSATATRAG